MSAESARRRIGVEAVVIIASILVAFAIDAAWAKYLERQEEATDLARVVVELEAERERLRSFEGFHALASSAAEALVEVIDGVGGSTSTVAVSDTLLLNLFRAPTFEVAAPTAEALVRSGRIFIVSDARVRRAMAAWDRSLRHAQELEVRARRLADDQLLPALAVRGPVGHVVQSLRLGGRARSDIDSSASTTIRVDEELAVLLSHRIATAGIAEGALRSARMAVDSVLVAIRASEN
jgi:hypothetical protein